MKVTLESTDRTITLVINGANVPARIWEGQTDSGIACHAFITRIGVHKELDASQFDRELLECRPPTNPDIALYPNRIVI
jgi:hypothetical protein